MTENTDHPTAPPHYPEQVPLEAYGNGGFRFAGMSHRGSLLLLPSGIYAWAKRTPDFSLEDFAPIFAEAHRIDFLILGTGERHLFPALEIREAFMAKGLGLEPMNSGAACRTYNMLLADGRAMAAAILAVP